MATWRFFDSALRAPLRMTKGGTTPSDEPVGDVDMCVQVFRRGILLENRADCDAEIWIFRQLLGPFPETVDVREGDDLPAFQDLEPVVDAGLSSGGQPEVAGHQARADDGGLLGLDQGDRHSRILQQKVFAEEALGEFPVTRQLPGLLHQGVNPGDAARGVLVFDAMTCAGVVFHYLACAAPAEFVDLEEDGVATRNLRLSRTPI